MEIAGKVAVVTGAATGIGKAIAHALANEGAKVTVTDIDEEGGARAAAEMGAAFVRADVASEEDVRELVRRDPLDILVNNACQARPGPYFPDAPVGEWASVLDVCLRGTMLCTQYAVEQMRGHGGAIVNVASTAGLGDHAHAFAEYATAKAGVVRLTVCLEPLAEEIGVRVNCIAPGWTATENVLERWAEMTPEERSQARDGFGRPPPEPLLEPKEVAEAALGLIRDDSLAGRTLVIDGFEPPHLLPTDRWE